MQQHEQGQDQEARLNPSLQTEHLVAIAVARVGHVHSLNLSYLGQTEWCDQGHGLYRIPSNLDGIIIIIPTVLP